MKRSIRIKTNMVVDIDDDGLGLPHVPDVGAALAAIATIVAPNATALQPGGKLDVAFTRQSATAIRQALRKRDGGDDDDGDNNDE